jgi:hypothetical protein
MRGFAAFVCLIFLVLPTYAAGPAKPVLECPKVMVHRADPAAHPG